MNNPVIGGQQPVRTIMDIPVPAKGRTPTTANKPNTKQRSTSHRKWTKWWPAFLVLLVGTILYSVLLKPRAGFRDPLSGAFRLSGNFGELRSNHFHMGLDVRTNGEENLPVYAVAEGYVSRIIIEETGLGKAIFITHPNGYTTVYAHLNEFYDQLEETVEAQQRSARKREQDLTFTAARFPVSKGQLIARSGNTGGSEAPHLHFEVRDTRTGNNLNPLLHGFDMDDDTPPVLAGLYWYNRQYSTYHTTANSISITGKEGAYTTSRSVIKVRSPLISLGIRATDKSNDNRFRFGIYRAELYFDGSLVHEALLDNFSYTDSRYINASVDYPRWIKTGIFIQHLSALPGNHLPALKGNGIMNLSDKKVHHLSIRMYDVNNNVSNFESEVQYSGVIEDPQPTAPGAVAITPGKEKTITGKQSIIRFSKAAFYDTVFFSLKEQPNTNPGKASDLVSLHNGSIPVHDSYTVSLKALPFINERLKKKVVMQLNNGKNKYTAKGTWKDNWLSASFNTLGTVELLIDTLSPAIQTVNWSSFSEDPEELKLICRDAIAGVGNFQAELDGEWLVFDRKGNDFSVRIPTKCNKGKHTLTITATDIAGNSKRETYSFVKR
ncbi:MAG: M23 family metallopeptidase [Niastella sp.]|nr:M23 family metallopeptidase [Niastella sp.]